MRIPKVENIEDADKYVSKFYITKNIIYSPLEKQIRHIFKGISDRFVSYTHYKNGYPDNSFYKHGDLSNLFVWVSFDDDSIIEADELYNDEVIAEILNEGTLTKEVIINTDNEWQSPIRIPRGLDVVLFLNEPEGKFEVQYKDVPDGVERVLKITELEFKERLNMHYRDYFKDMKNPHLRFKAYETLSSMMKFNIQFLTL